MALMAERLSSYSPKEHKNALRNYRMVAAAIRQAGMLFPGMAISDKNRSFWLFPVIVPNRKQFAAFALKNGLFVYRGATQ
jgi:hypothetical protein